MRSMLIYLLIRHKDMEQEQIYNEIVKDSQTEGWSQIYRKKGVKELVQTPHPDFKTVRHILEQCRDKYGNKPGLGQILVTDGKDENGQAIEKRLVKEYSYRHIFDHANRLGKALHDRKLAYKQPELGMRLIGIYSKNRLEWYVSDWACALFGYTVCPLYDTLGKENLEYCIDLCKMTTCFVSGKTAESIEKFKQKGSLRTIICYDEISQELKKKLNEQGLEVLGYWDLIEEGQRSETNYRDIEVKGDDIFSFCYTSGTTGPPKGALITNANMMASTAGFLNNEDIKFNHEDVYLSTLPLPHLMQRAISVAIFYAGAYLVVSSGDMSKLKEDVATIRSTIFVSVPRLYNKIVENLKGAINGLVNGAEEKRQAVENGVFQKFRQSFGGRIRMMLTGSAPILPVIQQYMQRAMGCAFIQGYGQTESPTALLLGRKTDVCFGMMAQIGSGVELRLQDIPEMKYTADDKDNEGRPTPRGQICARGPQIFLGYYKRPDLTKETIIDGWLHTGDVGQITPNLAFKIIDRKKNIFKLQQGEYVAPDKVEAIYVKSGLIEEVMLHGDSKNNFAVAVIVPRKDRLIQYGVKAGIQGPAEQMANKVEIRSAYLSDLNAYAKQQQLFSFMLAKNCYFELHGFASRGILTNTMKLIRYAGRQAYKQQIQAMYAEGQLKL